MKNQPNMFVIMNVNIRFISLIFFIITIGFDLSGQTFANKIQGFDWSKNTIVYLNNGDSIVGPLIDIKKKRGAIKLIALKIDKRRFDIEMDSIKCAYIPESISSKMNNFQSNVLKSDENKTFTARQDLLKDGYGYFEKVEVILKGDKYDLLLQLLNPLFADKVKVFADPYSSETAGYGIGGFTLEGGDDKSYFIKINSSQEPAFLLKKKNLEESYSKMFDCSALIEKLKSNFNWSDFESYIYENENCK